MPSELDLLRSLDDEPDTPSTVDVGRAIAAGRRHKVRRGAGYAGAAALTALTVAGVTVIAGLGAGTPATPPVTGATGSSAPAAAPPASCTLERLATPDDVPMALISGADPAGRYLVGRSYPKGGGYQAVIWHDGKPTKVMLPGDLEESLTDVNSTGTAVGWSYQGGGEQDTGPVPYVYQDGEIAQLKGVPRGSALAINDAGAIVGDDENGGAALLWPSATAQPTRLPLPDGAAAATAADIDEDGTVVGNLDLKVPYAWFADGTHRALPLPAVDGKPAASGRVFSIHNGWATGVVDLDAGAKAGEKARAKGPGVAGGMRTVRWNVRTGEVSVIAGLMFQYGSPSAQGWVAGTDDQGYAVLVAGSTRVKLPALAGHDPSGLANIPNTVSDDGRTVAGQSDDKSGTIRAVVWHCR